MVTKFQETGEELMDGKGVSMPSQTVECGQRSRL